MNTRMSVVCVCSVVAIAVAGCGKSESGSSSAGGAAATSAATASWVLASLPEGAVDVASAKQTVKEGDRVVVRGRIGGRVDPISADSAVFIVMDPAVPACSDNPEDKCATPWDYCCETPESMAANNATVQIVDSSGATIATDVRAAGLKPLDTVVIVGTVGPRPTPEVLVIRATGVHRVGG